MIKSLNYFVSILLALIIILSGCGSDSGTNAVDEDSPELPNLEYSQPDISYFQNTSVKPKSASNNFLLAKSAVLGFGALSNIGQLYGNILQSAPENGATFNDGTWEWIYDYFYGGISSQMRITATEGANGITWAVYWSFDDGNELSVENYKVMEGTTQNSGLTGDWTFNSLQPESNNPVPYLTSSWVTDGENQSDITLELFESNNSAEDILISYNQEGSEFLMTVDFDDPQDEDLEIGWNPNVNEGFYTAGSNSPLCWSAASGTLEDVSCN